MPTAKRGHPGEQRRAGVEEGVSPLGDRRLRRRRGPGGPETDSAAHPPTIVRRRVAGPCTRRRSVSTVEGTTGPPGATGRQARAATGCQPRSAGLVPSTGAPNSGTVELELGGQARLDGVGPAEAVGLAVEDGQPAGDAVLAAAGSANRRPGSAGTTGSSAPWSSSTCARHLDRGGGSASGPGRSRPRSGHGPTSESRYRDSKSWVSAARASRSVTPYQAAAPAKPPGPDEGAERGQPPGAGAPNGHPAPVDPPASARASA